MPGREKQFTDRDVEIALRSCGGSVPRAARWLGCHVLTIRNRVALNPELRALRVAQPRGRPPGDPSAWHRASRVVTDEQILAVLDRAASIADASRMLGVRRQTFMSRAENPTIAEAIIRCEQRWRTAEDGRKNSWLEERRREIADRLATEEAHRALIEEMRASWHKARDAWIVDAKSRGLSLLEMGRILGITRERVRQIETEILGLTPRQKGRRKRAA